MNDLRIYYDTLASPNVISSNCSRWDTQGYTTIIETWLTKDQLQTLRDNIVPGAASELYEILGQKMYYDKTWQGNNTIKISPYNDSNLYNMHGEKTIYVKNISDNCVGAETGYINVKIEGFVSGSRL